MIVKLYSWLLPLLGLATVAFGIGSYSCQRASWPHGDRIWGTGESTPAVSRGKVLHEQAYNRWRATSRYLGGASAISFAGFLFMVCRRLDRGRSSTVALVVGMVSSGIGMYLGTSIMDYDPAEQRPYAAVLQILGIIGLGCFLAASGLGLASRRKLGIAMGVLGVIACAINVGIASTDW